MVNLYKRSIFVITETQLRELKKLRLMPIVIDMSHQVEKSEHFAWLLYTIECFRENGVGVEPRQMDVFGTEFTFWGLYRYYYLVLAAQHHDHTMLTTDGTINVS